MKIKYKNKLLAAMAGIFFASQAAQAVIVQASSFGDDGNGGTAYATIVDSSNNLIPAGTGIIALGSFNTLSFDELQNMTFDQFVSDFNPYYQVQFGGVPSPLTGTTDGVFHDRSSIGNALIPAIGTRVYFLITNGFANAGDDVTTVTEYSLTSGFIRQLPPNDPSGLDRGANFEQLIAGNVLDTPISNPALEAINGLSVASTIQLVPISVKPIPEPSSSMLICFGAGLTLLRRKRTI